MPTPRKSRRSPWQPHWFLAAAAAAAILAVIAYAGYRSSRIDRAMSQAESQLTKNYGALAAETLEPVRRQILSTEKGCALLIGAYFQSQRTERLEWAAQACLDGGKSSPDAYIGLAAVREFRGKDLEALQILAEALPKFDKSFEIPFRLAQILKRNKRDDEAVYAYSQALQRAPNNGQLAVEAMDYLLTLQKWVEAGAIATRLKDVPTDKAEIKLLIARALDHVGDKNGSQLAAAQARGLLEKQPELKARLERAFGDVLGTPAH